MIDINFLKSLTPKGNAVILQGVVDGFNHSADKYEVNTPLRIAHFLAQCAHESAGFTTLDEFGGNTYFNKMYDTRTDLGNTAAKDGDGALYHGRGIIQITGKANYKTYGDKIGVDLVDNPDLAKTSDNSMLIALEYWKDKNLNQFADLDDIKTITKRINGGFNGLTERTEYLNRAKEYLNIGKKDDTVEYVQTMLIKLGYKIDNDGIIGPRTAAAIRFFQKTNKLNVTGTIDKNLIKTLEDQAG